jgi:hypothetical protein
MKSIVFDRHAKRRMKDRSVSREEVMTILETPDFIEQSIKGRINAFKFLNQRHLRVTYKDESDYLLIITVTTRIKPFKEQEDEN